MKLLLAILGGTFCFVVVSLMQQAHAGGGHHGDIYIDYSTHGVTSGALSSVLAASMAASQIQCSVTSRKHQAGVSTGYAAGKNAFAGGYCHSIADSPDYAATLGGTAVVATGMKPAYGLGLNFAW